MPELPLVGTDFAGYRLRAVLGRGGMSIVYQAENPRLGNVIALKVLAPELATDQVFRNRFREESQIAASLNHPHVIPIHDFGSSDGLLYIAMRYVAGTDLRHVIEERGALAPDAAVHLLGQAARALDAAHHRGLVHRDVKPGNLLIAQGAEDGDPDHVYLADFGITKYVGGRTGLTIAGTVLGTVHYAPPEQIKEHAVHGAADQYSLGCVLYECLTGRAPFEKSSNEAIMWAHVHDFPAPPSLLRPGLPPAIDEVINRALAKDPGDRYADCREFIAAARAALPVTRTPPRGLRSLPTGAQPIGTRTTGAGRPGARGRLTGQPAQSGHGSGPQDYAWMQAASSRRRCRRASCAVPAAARPPRDQNRPTASRRAGYRARGHPVVNSPGRRPARRAYPPGAQAAAGAAQRAERAQPGRRRHRGRRGHRRRVAHHPGGHPLHRGAPAGQRPVEAGQRPVLRARPHREVHQHAPDVHLRADRPGAGAVHATRTRPSRA